MKLKHALLTIILLGLFSLTSNAQLLVTTGTMTPTQYVQNVLVGAGVTISNVTFTGASSQLGEFNAVNTFINIPTGLILASGNVTTAIGPNNSGSAGTDLSGSGDPDLNVIAGIGTFDAAVLEFDFIPVGDSIKFNYVFGSEEYLEFVNSGVNDAFGFFLSGPGIVGPFTNSAVNLALIPNSTTPVTIDNVNNLSNAAYYVDNGTGTNAPYNTNPQYIQYDGHTVVLTAKSQVVCGQTYHLKIAISDAGDGVWDSGVFLEANSLTSEGVDIQIVTATGDSTIIEGCADATICFTRIDTTGADTVPIFISGTATNGVDYNLLPDSVYFLAGQSTVCFTIIPTADGINEGSETIIITAFTINACGDTIVTTGTIIVVDAPDIIVSTNDVQLFCPTSGITIPSSATGGLAPYGYVWLNMNGDTIGTNQNLNTPVNQTDTFIVAVTDSCNLSVGYDTVVVTVNISPLIVSAGNDTTLFCLGQSANLNGTVSGGNPGYSYNWMPGNISTPNFSVSNINSTTTFIFTVTDQCNTSVSDTVDIIVDYTPINITGNSGNQVLQCENNDHFLDIYTIPTNGTLPYSYLWSNTSADSLVAVNVTNPTTFIVTVTDACNVSATDTILFTFAPYTPMSLDIQVVDSICVGSETPLAAGITNGLPPYSFVWNDGVSFSSVTNPTIYSSLLSGTQMITLSVMDQCGIIEEITRTLEVIPCEIIIPNVITPNGDGMNDYLVFTNLQYYPKNKLVIFNRWGKKIFEKNGYQNDWDGGEYSDGTYFYILELNDNANTVHKGSLSLLK
ncbi:MAG: choice-of-anchor L domain-containing protein [Vicingaceae bacterium]|nr:choice-of-anchor L domain-containing protein [Vicingaceae bacterium]